MHIRLAQERDCEQISELYLQAFPADEGPVVAELALALLKGQSQPASLALVAEDGSAPEWDKLPVEVLFDELSRDAQTIVKKLMQQMVIERER